MSRRRRRHHRRPRGIVGYSMPGTIEEIVFAKRQHLTRTIVRRHREAKARERGGTYRPTKANKKRRSR